jgi:crotonobetainyl-CoA:carnitine CoA-transferase CaiB-like acyl-CoA transferase
MALEKRDGNLYYYRSVRDGEKVRKVYWGSGELARIAHEREIMDRSARQHERRESAKELERLEALAAPVLELCEVAEILTHAHLIASGHRRYQGHWRKRRARGEARSA